MQSKENKGNICIKKRISSHVIRTSAVKKTNYNPPKKQKNAVSSKLFPVVFWRTSRSRSEPEIEMSSLSSSVQHQTASNTLTWLRNKLAADLRNTHTCSYYFLTMFNVKNMYCLSCVRNISFHLLLLTVIPSSPYHTVSWTWKTCLLVVLFFGHKIYGIHNKHVEIKCSK